MANDVQNDGFTGQATETTSSDSFNAQAFLINQIFNGKWTITLCVVKSVSGGGASAMPATVSVQPMVNQLDGQNQATPHGTISGLPVFRLQGGSNAIITDPKVGDIGLMACASRDISAVKNTQKVSNPGSGRTFDPSDGMYLGGFLNAAPTNYVEVNDNGVNIVAGSTKITIAKNGQVSVVSNGAVLLNGLAWDTHTHPVTTAPGETGTPVA